MHAFIVCRNSCVLSVYLVAKPYGSHSIKQHNNDIRQTMFTNHGHVGICRTTQQSYNGIKKRVSICVQINCDILCSGLKLVTNSTVHPNKQLNRQCMFNRTHKCWKFTSFSFESNRISNPVHFKHFDESVLFDISHSQRATVNIICLKVGNMQLD